MLSVGTTFQPDITVKDGSDGGGKDVEDVGDLGRYQLDG